MLKQYIQLAVRNLFRKKLYTVINLTGLAIASAFAILIYLYVQQENSFDRFHTKGKNLYRLELTNLFNFNKEKPKKGFFSFLHPASEVNNMLHLPTTLPEELKQNFPEIKSFTRLKTLYKPVIRLHEQSFKMDDQRVAFAETNFFSVFSYPLLKGDPQAVLLQPDGVVINESTAEKYFANEDPVGKTILLERPYNKSMMVTGVMKDFPENSSMQFDMVLSVHSDPSFERQRKQGNNQFNYPSLLELRDNVDVAAFEKKLAAFCRNYFAASLEQMKSWHPEFRPETFTATIRPLADAHYNNSGGWYHYTDVEKIYQLVSLTILVLIIVCINYILLTLTHTVARSQEVGVRKMIGAGRRQLIAQFWTETQLLVVISVLVGWVLAKLTIPFFNMLTGASIHMEFVKDWNIGLMLLILAVMLGLLAGIYPALAMSGLKPLKTMRGNATYKLNPKLSKVFVVLQYTTCIILVISSLVVGKQMRFMLHKDLGFDKEQVLLIETPDGFDKEKSIPLRQRFFNYAASDPAIAGVTASTFNFADGYNTNGHIINGEQVTVTEMGVDYGYFEFNKIPIIKGRAFSTAFATDTSEFEIPPALRDSMSSSTNKSIVINETLYNMLGKPPMDEINKPMGSRIIGVCRDYHYLGLTQKIGPAYHVCEPGFTAYYWCKIKPNQDMALVIDRIHTNWNKVTANAPFDYSFLDETVQRFYEGNQRWMHTITLFSWLAVFIACLGLFGLSGLNTMNKTKEIGIRKVMGASVPNIFLLLNKDLVPLAIISMVIAIPLATYFAYEWLSNFAYRITVGWMIYAGAILTGFVSAALAVSYHSIKAAIAKPADALRSE